MKVRNIFEMELKTRMPMPGYEKMFTTAIPSEFIVEWRELSVLIITCLVNQASVKKPNAAVQGAWNSHSSTL